MRAVLLTGVAVVAMLGAGQARAAVVFGINSTSTTGVPFSVTGSAVVDQGVADAGFVFTSHKVEPFPPTIVSVPGLLSLDLRVTIPNSAVHFYTFSLDSFIGQAVRLGRYDLDLSGSTTTGLSGRLYASDTSDVLSLNLNGFTGSGTIDTDGSTVCIGSPSTTPCTFAAAITVTQNVPEPASLGLFGLALAGLAAVRRRHAAPAGTMAQGG